MAERLEARRPALGRRRGMIRRHFFAGAAQGELDKQGRLVIPATLLEHGRDHARGDGGRRVRPPGDLGSRHLAPTAARGRRERGRCCRASCQLSPITSPSSPRRSSRTSTRARARPSSTRTFGAGGHAALLAQRLRGDGKLIAIDRDPTVAPFFERFRRETASRRDCTTASSRPCWSTSRRTASRPTSSCSTSASRRCRSTVPSAASRTRSTRRSTCAWTRAPVLGARARQRRRASASSPTSSSGTARSGTRARSRARS